MIELPFPHKALWPNGRAHWAAKNREFQKHKQWAYLATRAVSCPITRQPTILYTVYPKTKHPIDADNAIGAMKAYQDGIAAALGLNDSIFLPPRVQFGLPEKPGKVVVSIL